MKGYPINPTNMENPGFLNEQQKKDLFKEILKKDKVEGKSTPEELVKELQKLPMVSSLAGDLALHQPKLICVQCDPMPYISFMRKAAIQNETFAKLVQQKQQEGIFDAE